MNWQEKYNLNRPPEVMGQREMSPFFFQTLKEHGPVAAFQWVRNDIKEHGHNNAALKATGLIVASAVLTTGLTQYVNEFLAIQGNDNLTFMQNAGLLVYTGCIGMIMAAHTDKTPNVEVHTEGQITTKTTTTRGLFGGTHSHTEIEVDEPHSYFDQK